MNMISDLHTPLLLQTLEAQKRAFAAELPATEAVRRDRLRRASAMLLRHAERFIAASQADFSNRPAELARIFEVFFPLEALRNAEKQLARWMRPERRRAPFPFSLFGARAEVQYQPLGSVGIIAPWNGALTLLFLPLAPVLAAGNRAFLRPSDLTPHCGEAAAAAVAEYFDPEEVAVATGGHEVSVAFSALPFDHLLFTGSTNVGRVVARAAAEHLTPVTLELGGKCPVFVLPDADLPLTARKLGAGKLLNGGQACIGPDTLYVPPQLAEPLMAGMDEEIRRQLPRGAADPDACGLIDERQYQRVASLIDEAVAAGVEARVLGNPGSTRDPQRRVISPTVLINPPAHLRASREELFGPVLVLRHCSDPLAVLRQTRGGDKPLALYVFSRDTQAMQRILDESFSGGVTLNDIASHFGVHDLPFGGVGHSGLGAYGSGKEGFKRFSHARAVYRQAGPFALTGVARPPFGKFYEMAIVKALKRQEQCYADVKPRKNAART
ncbi:aldehyde dehydrogenase family protein [Pelomonas sp. KK5]|uniref:aldehyde dehydrogenase family protein n=1 Tax=Pelomonas sp. KK5 TaxID=1855730 RepID=UPI0009FACEC7|nr:aldehyde dehydrogenase family protein [Pelomonas sp. KK5]